jgi:hypothetical protein
MTPAAIVERLSNIELPNVFNPYRHVCIHSDLPNAPLIRRRNLIVYLERMTASSPHIWFGRDLGHRGGRRTGLALTDEAHLTAFGRVYQVPVCRATSGPAMAERTSTVIWQLLERLPQPPFLWNVFPFHPHLPNDGLSNRRHTRAERKEGLHLLDAILALLHPSGIVALGADAHEMARAVGLKARRVRHPSFGGHLEFMHQMNNIYSLPQHADDLPLLPLCGSLQRSSPARGQQQ